MLFQLSHKEPPASAHDLEVLEDFIGSSISVNVVEFLREADGGYPDRDQYFIREHRLHGTGQAIGMEYLLSVQEMCDTIQALGKRLPKGALPFGDDDDGNYICVSHCMGKDAVFFWDFITGELIGSLFNSIAEFAKALGKGPLSE
jgi:hypothetical protein